MVVLAGVAVKEEKLLIAKRLQTKSNGGLWEFPGGKREEGESDIEGLIREFHEEFAVEISVHGFIGEFVHNSPKHHIVLRVYWVSIDSGSFSLVDHSEIAWLSIDGLSDYPFSPADIPVVEKLCSGEIALC